MAVPGQSPCKSGSPHAVRGAVHAFAGFGAAVSDWAATELDIDNVDASDANATPAARLTSPSTRLLM
jgi:hypothetical protein